MSASSQDVLRRAIEGCSRHCVIDEQGRAFDDATFSKGFSRGLDATGLARDRRRSTRRGGTQREVAVLGHSHWAWSEVQCWRKERSSRPAQSLRRDERERNAKVCEAVAFGGGRRTRTFDPLIKSLDPASKINKVWHFRRGF